MDDRAVQRKCKLWQIWIGWFVLVELMSLADQHVGHRCKQSPIPILIGISQIGSCNATSKSQMIKQLGTAVQTGHNISEALSISKLSKAQRQKMIVSRKASIGSSHGKLLHTTSKGLWVDAAQNLGEHRSGNRHGRFIPPHKPESITCFKNAKSLSLSPFGIQSLPLTGHY